MRSRCCVCVCVCVCIPLSLLGNASVKIPVSLLGNSSVKIPLIVVRQRLGKNPPIVARQRLGKNPRIAARRRLGKNPLIAAWQRLGRNVTAVTNTHATIKELLDASFSMWPVSYQEKYSSSQNFLLYIHTTATFHFIPRFLTNEIKIMRGHHSPCSR
jgi:hypothetical protein